MAGEKTNHFEIPEQMREFTEKSVDQARKAFDDFMAATQKAVDEMDTSTNDMTAGAHEVNRKILELTEENMTAAFAHAQRLIKAKDLQEVLVLQSDFLKSQMASLGEQARVIGDVTAKTATNYTDRKFDR